MHPVLVEIPLPRWNVALTPWLVALSILALVVCVLGRFAHSRELFWGGLFGSAVAFVSALAHRGESVETGPFTVYWFGTLLSLSLLCGSMATVRLARLEGLPPRATLNACLATGLSGFFGARMFYVITNARDFQSWGDVIAFQNGGMTFYGGAAAGALSGFFVLRRSRVSFLVWGDAAAPGAALSIAIGRIGCYLAGCDFGTPLSTRAPKWLQRLGTFPRWPDEIAGSFAGSPAWVEHVLSGRIPLAAKASLPVHPTELYEAAIGLALSAALIALRTRRKFRGQVFVAFVLAYGAIRFALESLRGDPERGLWGPLSASQWIALALSISVAVGARQLAGRRTRREAT